MDALKESIDKLAEQIQATNIAHQTMLQTILNQIDQKLDILANGEAVAPKPKPTVKSKNQLLKAGMKEDINKWLNVLYSQEDLDRLFEHPDVSSRKEQFKIGKLSDILYKEIMADPIRKKSLDDIHESSA